MDRDKDGQDHHQQQGCDEGQADPRHEAAGWNSGDLEEARLWAKAPKASISLSRSSGGSADAEMRVACIMCRTAARWGAVLDASSRSDWRSSHLHWGSVSGILICGIGGSFRLLRCHVARINDDPGKTPSIPSMEMAGLSDQLNGRTTAGNAKLPSCLRKMGLYRGGRQSQTIGDLRSLKMIGDALKTATFLASEAVKPFVDMGGGDNAHRSLRPVVSRPGGGL